MKTAKEIIDEYGYFDGDQFSVDHVIKMINEGRREALQVASEKVNYPYKDEFGCGCDVPSIVLQLINEIK
jgi:hypothetical protein